ncbi:FAD-dependent oxidoreductase [Sulfurimonas sp. SAG-AH-194-C21]|nr:FAD-dependent oxidoreductase [Sulfurimonas sp. SAG-AH-194-C21]MDF1883674.1 FAD-dependent oxidoreductase [Sulfurimonas sp. SAG-AH-194-C21]
MGYNDNMDKKKITIIGAGVSGLYLAYLLEDKFDIRILEARKRVGGRIYSISGNDMGPSWIWSHQKNVLKLVDALGLELFTQFSEGNALYDTKERLEVFRPQPSAPSTRISGTLSQLINKLEAKLQNTQIILDEKVESVQEKHGNRVVRTGNKEYESDYVIVTLPPRLAAALVYEPALPQSLKQKMLDTQTWMGASAKCVVEFSRSFWRDKGLSGFTFSPLGPLGEIHDASEGDKHALFGFVGVNTDMQDFQSKVQAQMIRLFDIKKSDIQGIHLLDWREELYSSSAEDKKPLNAHPEYGIDTSEYGDRVLFGATEFSYDNGGYIEGAIVLAQEISEKLHNA